MLLKNKINGVIIPPPPKKNNFMKLIKKGVFLFVFMLTCMYSSKAIYKLAILDQSFQTDHSNLLVSIFLHIFRFLQVREKL